VLPALIALLIQPPTESVTIREGECYAMVPRDGQIVSTRIPDFHVIEATARDGPLVVNLPEGTGAIACPRSSIIPAPNDWKVLAAGYPLMIMETGGPPGNHRVGALEASQGQVRLRMVAGDLTESETQQLRTRLNQLQESGRD